MDTNALFAALITVQSSGTFYEITMTLGSKLYGHTQGTLGSMVPWKAYALAIHLITYRAVSAITIVTAGHSPFAKGTS